MSGNSVKKKNVVEPLDTKKVVCIIHCATATNKSDKFTSFSNSKADPNEKLKWLLGIRNQRLQVSASSNERMQSACDAIPENLDTLNLDTTGWHRGCYSALHLQKILNVCQKFQPFLHLPIQLPHQFHPQWRASYTQWRVSCIPMVPHPFHLFYSHQFRQELFQVPYILLENSRPILNENLLFSHPMNAYFVTKIALCEMESNTVVIKSLQAGRIDMIAGRILNQWPKNC